MKITAVKSFAMKTTNRNVFVVKVETDSDIYGIGEGGTSGRERATAGMIDHFARMLVGQDPRRIEHLWQMMYRRQYFEGGTIIASALSAVDIALWDILGKSLGVPVYQLLGGRSRNFVRCFTDAGALVSDQCVEQAKRLVADGWSTIRFFPDIPSTARELAENDGTTFEPRESIEQAVHWLTQVRQAVGPAINLAVDYHHRLSVAEAATFCQRVEPIGLMFLEEPIRSENAKAYAALRRMTPMPFAIGEEFSSKWAFLPFIEEGLTNFARVDLCNVGGFTEAMKVAGWCEAHYIDMMPHNPLGVVCAAASAHFCTAINNFALQECNPNSSIYPQDLFPHKLRFDHDRIIIDDTPGLGVEFNEQAAKDYPFEFWEAPMHIRRDGSYTNW